MGQRVLFKKGEQRKFLDLVRIRLNSPSLKSLLQFGFKIKYSVLKNYFSESLLLPKSFFDDLCHLSKINPESLNVRYLEGNWGQIIGGKKAMQVLIKKYPQKIKKWRKLAMLNSPVIGDSNLKEIKIPELDEKLAEFIGAYLGDGTLNKYQLRIAGDHRYDFYYYIYLSNLIFELFGIKPSIKKQKNRNTSILLISSKNVCSFLNKNFNLKYGNKIHNQTTIPKQILENEKLSIACLRGLIDTDGSVTRRGNQFCLQFTAHNKLLLSHVSNIGEKLGIFTYFDKTGAGTNRWKNVVRYFELVGSSNLKHIIRFYVRKYENKSIYRKDLPFYFKQDLYRDLDLPFKIKGPVV